MDGRPEIKSISSARFLEIIFDFQFTFREHVKSISVKCQKAHRILKFFSGTRRDANPETLLILYKSYVWSILDYDLFVYYPKTISLAETIEKIQYSVLRTVMGYRLSTPKNIILEGSKNNILQPKIEQPI